MYTKQIFFSANYTNTDNNFVIQNADNTSNLENQYYSAICILKNILQRGTPSSFSRYLTEQLGEIPKLLEAEEKIHLINAEPPLWHNRIKGYDLSNAYPARYFYEEIIPKYLTEYNFIQQLTIPEAYINDITGLDNDMFKDNQVDFYIPIAKLVIEIDGSQHKNKGIQYTDIKRDKYLTNAKIKVIRIPSECIETKNTIFFEKLHEIEERFSQVEDQIRLYQKHLNLCEHFDEKDNKTIFQATAIMRFQITVLELIARNYLDLSSLQWNITIREHDISGFEEYAIEDIKQWLFHICKLQDIPFEMPKVIINIANDTCNNKLQKNEVFIDFSLFKSWTDENETNPDLFYVRNDYYQRDETNYFRLSTTAPVRYCIDDEFESKHGTYDERIKSLIFVLQNLFGFTSFKDGQLRIIINALKLRNTIGLLPTGSGKSLCFQMAAMLQPCVSLCVCPIKALMYDQLTGLTKRHINRITLLNSDQNSSELEKYQNALARGEFWWAFISPERFQDPKFRKFIDSLNKESGLYVGYAVIDEVHCLSEWGHSFRTSYLNLIKTIKKYCPSSTLIGLTATASQNVLKNILIEFNMLDTIDVKSISSFTRRELDFKICKVKPKSAFNELKKIFEGYKKKYPDILLPKSKAIRAGLIFTPNVNGSYGCYQLSKDLIRIYQSSDIRYFSGSKPDDVIEDADEWEKYKHTAQTDFSNDVFPLMVATNAFGMGIDKQNVRFTIHYGLPSSLEALYQEAGRAGRDGKKAQCIVIYTPEQDDIYPLVKEALSFETSVSRYKEILAKVNPKNYYDRKGEDIFRQIYLFSSGLNSFEHDIGYSDLILQKYAMPGAQNVILSMPILDKDLLCSKTGIPAYMKEPGNDKKRFEALEKIVFHLSVIGVIDDWTIQGYRHINTPITVNFAYYCDASISEKTLTTIKQYDAKFDLKLNNHYNTFWSSENLTTAQKAIRVYWLWYYDHIVYSRKQALLHVAEACERFTPETAEQFKEEMESYFRHDEIADQYGVIADVPDRIKEWFQVLSVHKYKQTGIGAMIMSLNRYLESYRNNTGLNFISGILRLLNHDFDSLDGRNRLQNAIHDINSYSDDQKVEIVDKLTSFLNEIAEMGEKEILSEFMLHQFELNNLATRLYCGLNDNYSLNRIINNTFQQVCDNTRRII